MRHIENEYKSGMNLKKLFVTKSEFSRNEILSNNAKMELAFDSKLTEIDKENFKVVLTGRVFSEDKDVTASTEIVAFFTLFTDSKDFEPLNEWREQNAMAIMFPYLRAQFTLISSQSNIPLVIPAVNINAYFEDKAKK